MKILIIAPEKPNRYNRIRLHNTVKALKLKHQVKLVYPHNSRFQSYFNCFINIYKPIPFEASYYYDPKLKRKIKTLAPNYDLVIIKRLRMSINLPSNLNTTVVIDTTDAMSLYYQQAQKHPPIYLKLLFLHEYYCYQHFEKQISNRFTNWICCSETDKKYLKNRYPNLNISIIPNVVDTSFYQTTQKPLPNTILFSGLMNKQVNITAVKYFIKNIWPLIIKKNPKTKLYIVGPNPPKKIRSLSNANIIVTGKVKNIREYLEISSVVICPIVLGTGTRNKILQAWAMKRPVVSTKLGIQDLDAQNNVHALITDSPKIFAQNVLNLLSDKRLSAKLTNNAHKHVSQHFDIKNIASSYEKFSN